MKWLLLFIASWFFIGLTLATLIGEFVTLPLSIFQCGLLGLLVGLIGLALVTSTERGRRMFFQGPEEDEEGDLQIACLWAITFQLLGFVAVAWLAWQVIQLIR